MSRNIWEQSGTVGSYQKHLLLLGDQSMSPIAKIEIAIAIWKMNADPDLDRSFTIADLLSDLLNYNKGSFSSDK